MKELFKFHRNRGFSDCEKCGGKGYTEIDVPGSKPLRMMCMDCERARIRKMQERVEHRMWKRIGQAANNLSRRRAKMV